MVVAEVAARAWHSRAIPATNVWASASATVSSKSFFAIGADEFAIDEEDAIENQGHPHDRIIATVFATAPTDSARNATGPFFVRLRGAYVSVVANHPLFAQVTLRSRENGVPVAQYLQSFLTRSEREKQRSRRQHSARVAIQAACARLKLPHSPQCSDGLLTLVHQNGGGRDPLRERGDGAFPG